MTGPMVERKARIFRFGHYPKKNWSITREQFIAANGETGTVPIGIDPIRKGHYVGTDSVLDGETGTASFSVEGDEVLGSLKVPEWIDRAARKWGLKISGVFSRATGAMSKIDLVERSHIPDAVIFADEHDEVVIFEDDEPEDDDVEFCDGKGNVHVQAMHDMAGHSRPGLCSGRVGFAATKEETDDDRAFRQSHDYAVHEGAYCPGMPDGFDETGEVSMADDNTAAEIEYDLEEAVVSFSDDQINALPPKDQAFIRLNRKLMGKVTKLQDSNDEKDAVAFAESVCNGANRKALPVERKHIIDGYKRAASDDARLGDTVTFTDDAHKAKTGTRLDAFKALYAIRPRLTVTDPTNVVFNELGEEPDGAAEATEKAKADREDRRKRNASYLGQPAATK